MGGDDLEIRKVAAHVVEQQRMGMLAVQRRKEEPRVRDHRDPPLLDPLEQTIGLAAVGIPAGIRVILDATHAPLLDAAPEDGHRVLAPRVDAGARDEPRGMLAGEVGHLAEQQLALGIPQRREVLGGELLRGQLLTAVAADVDTEVRGEGFPEWLREPLALHQVVVRVDDDGHETAGSLP